VNVIIRAERPEERPEIDAILDEVYPNSPVPEMIRRLWRSHAFNPELSVVADRAEHIMGYALYFPVMVQGDGIAYKAVHMSPIVVRAIPDKQQVGERLVRTGMQRAHSLGNEIVLVMGPTEYFSRLGFRNARRSGFSANLPVSEENFMVHQMNADNFGKIGGTVLYPPGIVG
jgi:putative acetyltransferase